MPDIYVYRCVKIIKELQNWRVHKTMSRAWISKRDCRDYFQTQLQLIKTLINTLELKVWLSWHQMLTSCFLLPALASVPFDPHLKLLWPKKRKQTILYIPRSSQSVPWKITRDAQQRTGPQGMPLQAHMFTPCAHQYHYPVSQGIADVSDAAIRT